MLLFLADRAQHIAEVIRPALSDGKWVLCDRFSDSTVVYQLAARKMADSFPLVPLLEFAQQQTVPDLTLWFDLPLESALARIATRHGPNSESRMDSEQQAFHHAVHQGFSDLHQQHPQRIQRIDARGEIDRVQQQVRAILAPHLEIGLP